MSPVSGPPPIEKGATPLTAGSSDGSTVVVEADVEAEAEADIVPPKSLRFKMTVLFLCVVAVLGAIDAVIVAACLAAIARDLLATSVETFWVGTSFLLGQTVTIPIYSAASEAFGRKWAIISAIALFLFGSILCATAENITWLIAARTVQGIGAGGTIQLVQVVLSDITTMQERGLYIAMSSFGWAFGTIAGVPIGGAIGEYATWRWAFWINVPICVICILGLLYSLNLHGNDAPFMVKLARIDWIGLALFTTATTLFLVGLTSGGVSSPWGSAGTLAPLIIGAALYIPFVLVEWRVAKNPMMPLRIFNDRTAVVGFATSLLQGMILWCTMYYMIIYFLGSRQHTLFRSAAETLSNGAFVAPAGVVASILIKRTLKFKYIIIVGWVLVAVGTGINVATMRADSSKGAVFGPRCISGLGAGLLFPTPLFAVQARQRSEDVGIATSVQVFFRSLGMTFGVAIGGVVFQNRWSHLEHAKTAEGSIPQAYSIPSSLAELAFEVIKGFPAAVQEQYRGLYADSLISVWWVMTAFALVGTAISLVARDEKLSGGLSGNQNFKEKDQAEVRGAQEQTV